MAAGEPTTEPRSRRGWWIAAGTLAFLLITGLVILWIRAPDLYGAKDGATQATATTRGGILTVAAALIAATAAGAGLYFTARTVRETQRANQEADDRGWLALEETRRANREADRRDRYAKAIEQLGHAKAPVRLGAMYSLERLAQDNPELRQPVVDVLCAYLRMPFKSPKRDEPATESRAEGTEETSPPDAPDREAERNAAEELLVRQTAQRLLGDHLRRPPDTTRVDAQGIEASPEVIFWPGISLDLTEASLVDLDLREASVIDARFDGAAFSGKADAAFVGATFFGDAWFRRATFSGEAWFDGAAFFGNAAFVRATFSGYAGFDQATFSGYAWFDKAAFSGYARFDKAIFFGDASFTEAAFSEWAWFDGATFSRAFFWQTTFYGYAWFDKAAFSGYAGFDKAIFFGGAGFDGAAFSGDSNFGLAHVLHIDDPNLETKRKWPGEWMVCPDADDSTRGILVRRGSDP